MFPFTKVAKRGWTGSLLIILFPAVVHQLHQALLLDSRAMLDWRSNTPMPINETTNDFAGIRARAFDPLSRNESLYCPAMDPGPLTWQFLRTAADTGQTFIKLMKVGGSTAAGFALRIAQQEAIRREKNFTQCRIRYDHSHGHIMIPGRIKSKSFLWTLVREPTKRVISHYFHFEVSRKNETVSVDKFLNLVRKPYMMNYYLGELSPQKIKRANVSNEQAVDLANEIFDEYDFIGVTERMDETAVALSMILHVPLRDVLYLSSKTSGSYDAMCTFIQKSFVSDGMKEYLESPEWQAKVKWDSFLYQAANRSLDLTIDRLGRTQFEINLRTFRKIRDRAQEICLPRELFPCTSQGVKNPNRDCLWSDSGCGYKCLDEVATLMGLRQTSDITYEVDSSWSEET